MIKLVKQRPFQKTRRYEERPNHDRGKSKSWKLIFIKIIWISFFVFAFIYWGFLLFKNTIFSPQYIIKKIHYNSWDISRYDWPYFYKAITYQLKWENYRIAKLNRSSIVKQIQTQFPILSNLVIEYTNPNTVDVKIDFHKPQLIIKNQNLEFWVYNSYIFPIYSWNQIWKWARLIDLPDYLSWLNGLSWFFFQQTPNDFFQQIELIYQWFPKMDRIEYVPWWQRTIIYLGNKKIYINNLWDIPQQIKNFELLKKYYSDYGLLKEIDLGSIEKDKIIVKK